MIYKIVWRRKRHSEIFFEGLFNYKNMEDAREAARTLIEWQKYFDMSIEAYILKIEGK